jgi:PRTRC genetic system protein B
VEGGRLAPWLPPLGPDNGFGQQIQDQLENDPPPLPAPGTPLPPALSRVEAGPVFVAAEPLELERSRLLARLDFYGDQVLAHAFEYGTNLVGHRVAVRRVDPQAIAVALGAVRFASGMLPEHALTWAHTDRGVQVSWYVPPGTQTLLFQGGEARAAGVQQRFRIPLPGLVLVSRGGTWMGCWAVKQRPTPETPLYLAPLFNVRQHDGWVCWGNVPAQRLLQRGGTASVTEAIWRSVFTHTYADGKSRRYPEDVLEMWKGLALGEFRKYPTDDLVAWGDRRLRDVVTLPRSGPR